MKYEVKIDLWIKLLFYMSIVLIIGPIFTIPENEMLIFIIVTSPIIIFILWMLYGSYLEFRDDELYVKVGPIYKKEKYSNIKSISINTSWLSSYALTKKRVTIKIHNKTWKTNDFQVGPKNREEFVDELNRRCRHLELK